MSHDDFAFEPVKGLPERPPEGEHILWQGRPNWWALTRESLMLDWVAGYFVVLAFWRFGTVMDLVPLVEAIALSVPFLILGAVACGLLMLTGYVQARATVYTITNRRVAMRIGAALTVTLNLPYTQLGSADLKMKRSGIGTIALDLLGPVRFSYLVCWPHVRPWYLRKPQPALRCIPEAEKVANILAEAAAARLEEPKIARQVPQATAIAAE
ncbi:MAG: photosynthetic complex putative assembly protein PuhB [Pseudomonadota bacterium]